MKHRQLELFTDSERIGSVRMLATPNKIGRRLGVGSSRICYALTCDVVIKLPRNLHRKSSQSMREVKNWERVQGTKDARYFAPVLARHENGGVAMLRAVSTVSARWVYSESVWNKVEAVRRYLGHALGIVDLHRRNMGIFPDGTIRVLDYGIAYNKVLSCDPPDNRLTREELASLTFGNEGPRKARRTARESRQLSLLAA